MPDNRTILGPLTDSWTYPTYCSRLYLADCSTCSVAAQAQKCNTAFPTTINGREDILCWPPATPSIAFEPPLSGWGFYKPASECPEGYTVACTAVGTAKSDFEFQFEVNDDEFVRGCCPSNYECAKYGKAQTCRSVYSTGTTQVISCDSGTTVLKELTRGTITMQAPMFQLAGLRRLEASTTGDRPATSTSSSTGSPTSEMGSDSGGGLSTGARAGIGVGVGVIGLGIIAVAFYLWRRRKKSKPPTISGPETSQLDSQEVNPPGELEETLLSRPPPPYVAVELDGTARQELP
ncbi:hypothetical protein FLONG3_609 [Fusarium longipes]|uniref:Uncharacterized protein n=1 Tax=Fusarium longipes TaxID=694270 RepID=A0A395T9P3_9HYPO|nr:hypothetical protein FLONG3_609 [Fusarium longipes]